MAYEDDDIPLPEDLSVEEEAPYRRRRKAVPVRRRRFASAGRLFLWSSLALVVLAPLAFLSFRLGGFAASTPLFRLDPATDITVEGNHYVSSDEIISTLGIPSSTNASGAQANIFRLSLDDKRRQLESIPWILSATIRRAFPHQLHIRVVERTPVAFANVGGRVQLVDGEGILMERPDKASFDFPVVVGIDVALGAADRKQRMALYRDFTQQIADELLASGWVISECDVADPDDLKALLVQGQDTIMVHFGHRAFKERFHNFLTSFPEIRKLNSKIDSVDLRYGSQIVVNPVTEGKEGAREKVL